MDRGGVGLPQGPYAEAFAVDRDELGGQAASVADVGKFFVSGVLKGEDRGGAQDLDQSLIQEFRSGADDDLGRGDLHPPVPPQIVGDGLTQRQQPVIGDVRKKFPVGVRQDLPHEFRPHGDREQGKAAAVALEVDGKPFFFLFLIL